MDVTESVSILIIVTILLCVSVYYDYKYSGAEKLDIRRKQRKTRKKNKKHGKKKNIK